MSNELKKVIAAAIASGAIVGGGFFASDKLNCDYEFEFEGETICLSEEQKQIIEAQLPVSQGFGGIKLGG